MAEDAEWVLESVLGFLGGPVWTGPVMEFVEQKCLVFDDEEENKFSYTEIHGEYKKLVENLLEGHIDEVGISEEQFQEACASPLARSAELQVCLQPVFAAEDFAVFKAMMLQKNIELQLQAIKIIQEKNGVLPDCLQNGTDLISDLEQQEIKLLTEALRLSKEEYEREQLRRTAKSADTMYPCEGPKLEIPVGHKESTHLAGETAKTPETKQQPFKADEQPKELPIVILKGVSNAEAAEAWLTQARREAGIQSSNHSLSQTEKEQLQKRAEYLKQKRDQLMERKLDGKKDLNHDMSKDEAAGSRQELTEEEIRNLEKRKRLAEKLREEVINK
uniref:Cilia- and flagella-associated protein 36 n=1 Tax=Leptobrachium leishanense TaxID=445787 RepID=A0A8C5Q8F1_9ANUR